MSIDTEFEIYEEQDFYGQKPRFTSIPESERGFKVGDTVVFIYNNTIHGTVKDIRLYPGWLQHWVVFDSEEEGIERMLPDDEVTHDQN